MTQTLGGIDEETFVVVVIVVGGLWTGLSLCLAVAVGVVGEGCQLLRRRLGRDISPATSLGLCLDKCWSLLSRAVAVAAVVQRLTAEGIVGQRSDRRAVDDGGIEGVVFVAADFVDLVVLERAALHGQRGFGGPDERHELRAQRQHRPVSWQVETDADHLVIGGVFGVEVGKAPGATFQSGNGDHTLVETGAHVDTGRPPGPRGVQQGLGDHANVGGVGRCLQHELRIAAGVDEDVNDVAGHFCEAAIADGEGPTDGVNDGVPQRWHDRVFSSR